MKVLAYTIACGNATKAVQRIFHPPTVLVLDEHMLQVHPLDRINVRAARTRIREFLNIDVFDAVICLETDVELPTPLIIGDGNSLEIEKGYCPMSDLAFGLSEDIWSPWNGYVVIPRKYYWFLDKWAAAYQWFGLHGVDEQVLLEALEGVPYIWRDVIHHRGAEKLLYLPEYGAMQAQEFFGLKPKERVK